MLRYGSLDEVMPDVVRLLAGHKTVGRWSLAQICRHLGAALRLSVDRPASVQQNPSQYATADQKRRLFESGMMDEGRPMPPGVELPGSLDDRKEADSLRDAIAHYKASPGPAADHPRLGPLSRAEWDRFHCIHCAHHLSFAVPVENEVGPQQQS
jgi:hypothetical protein